MFRYFDVSIWRLNGEDEVVPVLGDALFAKHIVVEPAACRSDAFLRVGCQGGNVLGLDANFDQQADVIVLFAHAIEAEQFLAEPGIDTVYGLRQFAPVALVHAPPVVQIFFNAQVDG